ncbi:hypothetical protein CAPTEDRAFT_218754 [Capitella teleta]|uniref:Ufm1-specific protease 2 n=1 Tax=Capitella teleta TaxID=283909 RepID=R7UNG8_CAPTE|nr:hypothetical protein CAPTEDRAFT_218754 [Capitella teleta]|eukprot:ELU04946.1 hypothetical protein CAPTEDRAFT_218754 [Capitella teleta]
MACGKVSISPSIFSNLASSNSENIPRTGFLFGIRRPNSCQIIGCKVFRDGSLKNMCHDYTATFNIIPGGLDICGVFFKTGESAVKPIVAKKFEKFIPEIEKIKGLEDSASILVLALENRDLEKSTLYDYNFESQDLTKVDYNVGESNSLLKLRVRGTLSTGFEVPAENDKLFSNIHAEITALKNSVEGEACAYHLNNSRIILHNNYAENIPENGLSANTSCSQLTSHINASGDDVTQKKKQKSTTNDVIDFNLLLQMTGEVALSSTVTCAPVIHHEHRQYKFSRISLPIDALAYVYQDDPVEVVPNALTSALTSQLLSMLCCIMNHSKNSAFPVPRPHHMLPPYLSHFLTVVYPDNVDDDSLESERRSLQHQFLLPLNKPLLRPRNAFKFSGDFVSDYLINTHVGLKTSVPGGKQFVVQGDYEYHHYMQDRMDDNGWGCAYRSLQTLISWFKLQGYTEKLIPTHKQIQQILVDIGDKPLKLVGSKEWIGSMEVSYVLQNYLDVNSKILFVSTGAELASKARELAEHFLTQGTPIMAGGGVLAQTILGVDWNEDTGDLKYLILDPHYTGGEDLKVIQDKGWCGWKGQEFWDQNTYYNLCMPQLPDVI